MTAVVEGTALAEGTIVVIRNAPHMPEYRGMVGVATGLSARGNPTFRVPALGDSSTPYADDWEIICDPTSGTGTHLFGDLVTTGMPGARDAGNIPPVGAYIQIEQADNPVTSGMIGVVVGYEDDGCPRAEVMREGPQMVTYHVIRWATLAVPRTEVAAGSPPEVGRRYLAEAASRMPVGSVVRAITIPGVSRVENSYGLVVEATSEALRVRFMFADTPRQWLVTAWEFISAPQESIRGGWRRPSVYDTPVGSVVSAIEDGTTRDGTIGVVISQSPFRVQFRNEDGSVEDRRLNGWRVIRSGPGVAETWEDNPTFENRAALLGRTIRVVRSGYIPEGFVADVMDTYSIRESSRHGGVTVGVMRNGRRSWVQEWDFVDTEPARWEDDPQHSNRDRLIGRQVRVIRGNSGVTNGSVYTVTGSFHRREGGSTYETTVEVSGDEDILTWVHEWELIPLDGQIHEGNPGDFPEGTRVRAVDVPSIERMNGAVGTVYKREPEGRVGGRPHDRNSTHLWVLFDNNEGWFVRQWQVLDEAATPVEPTPVEAAPEPVAPVVNVRESAEYRELMRLFEQSVDIISERLNDEARERGWCRDYERAVVRINERLQEAGSPFTLDSREGEYTVTWTETYEVHVGRSETVTAESPEHAERIVRDSHVGQQDRSDIIESLRDGASYDLQYDSADDFDVERD